MRSISALSTATAEAATHAKWISCEVSLTCAANLLNHATFHSFFTVISVHSVCFLFYTFTMYRYAIPKSNESPARSCQINDPNFWCPCFFTDLRPVLVLLCSFSQLHITNLHSAPLPTYWNMRPTSVKNPKYCHLLAIPKNYFWGRTTNSWWLNFEGLAVYAAFWSGWMTQFQNILTLYYTQDHWLSGLCPLSGILKEYNVLDTRPGPMNEISCV
jgi:hypothetical protein